MAAARFRSSETTVLVELFARFIKFSVPFAVVKCLAIALYSEVSSTIPIRFQFRTVFVVLIVLATQRLMLPGLGRYYYRHELSENLLASKSTEAFQCEPNETEQ